MIDKIKVWEEIYDVIREEELRNTKLPDEKTSEEIREELNIGEERKMSREQVRRHLDKLVESGNLTRRKIILDGRQTNVYSPSTNN